jgi:hypothetical protein
MKPSVVAMVTCLGLFGHAVALVENMTCAVCADVPVGDICVDVGQQTSNPSQTSCYEVGEAFLEGGAPAGDFCSSSFAVHNRDCPRAHCRPSYSCVASAITQCPGLFFVRLMLSCLILYCVVLCVFLSCLVFPGSKTTSIFGYATHLKTMMVFCLLDTFAHMHFVE